MKPDIRFLCADDSAFWAIVRSLSQSDPLGYSVETIDVDALKRAVLSIDTALGVKPPRQVPDGARIVERDGDTRLEITRDAATAGVIFDRLSACDTRKGWHKAVASLRDASLRRVWIRPELLLDGAAPTALGTRVLAYLQFRKSQVDSMRLLLMRKNAAKELFNQIRRETRSTIAIPRNKQKDDKSGPAYFTGIIQTLMHHHLDGRPCDFDPKALATFTRDDATPVLTMSRRMDGVLPSLENPAAVWEIKEYYNTTSFGSRVAGGVYETVLDGLEIRQAADGGAARCKHYVFIDGYETWWEKGRSYLCRFVDAIHMGLVDEVLVGREVETRLPALVGEWISTGLR